MKDKIKPYKGPVFVGGAMAAAALFYLLGIHMEKVCGACAEGSAVLWIVRAMASLSVLSMTQLLWCLHVENRGSTEGP